jgi:hypothetical protein
LAVAVIAFFGGWFLKAWEEKRKREDRIAQRSEDAAAEMLPMIDDLRARFEPFWGTYEGPPQGELEESFENLNRLSVDITPEVPRQKLRDVASAFYYYQEACPFGPEDGWLPNQVARKAAAAGYELIGAIRRHERTPPTPELDEITGRIDEFERYLERQEERDLGQET